MGINGAEINCRVEVGLSDILVVKWLMEMQVNDINAEEVLISHMCTYVYIRSSRFNTRKKGIATNIVFKLLTNITKITKSQ